MVHFGARAGIQKNVMVWNRSFVADAMAMVHPKRRPHLATKLVEPLSASLTGLNVEVLCGNHLAAKAFSTLVSRANLSILIKDEVVDYVIHCVSVSGRPHLASKNL